MGHAPTDYHAFMLRIWKERSQEPDSANNLRMSLENTQTGTRIGFADLQALVDFLQKQMDEGTPAAPDTPADDPPVPPGGQ